jgi:hypothetical protein
MRDWLIAHYDVLKDFAGSAVAACALIATTTLAIAGLRTFGRWKREKIEEKRIEIAIEALAIGYEAQLVFERVRSRIVRDFESEDIGRNSGDTIVVKDDLRRGPYAVLKRLEASQDFFDRVYKLEPQFVAVFGAAAEAVFDLLQKARRQVETTAEALIDEYSVEHEDDEEGRERRRKWRTNIFASPSVSDENDEVGKLLKRFRQEIERLCRPIVEREFHA